MQKPICYNGMLGTSTEGKLLNHLLEHIAQSENRPTCALTIDSHLVEHMGLTILVSANDHVLFVSIPAP